MLKLTKTGIGLLTKQYRSVLRKCLLLNLGFVSILNNSYAEYDWHILSPYYADRPSEYAGVYIATNRYDVPYVAYDALLVDIANGRFPTVYATKDALNYYYTFRVGERAEVIEFTKELKGNEKEMSSLDFMPIKSSSDLRINWIKAEDPLTFSAKTRDDSLVLMEVCHA